MYDVFYLVAYDDFGLLSKRVQQVLWIFIPHLLAIFIWYQHYRTNANHVYDCILCQCKCVSKLYASLE